MMYYNITWIAKGYEALNETIEVGTDIIDCLNKFTDKMRVQFPDTKIVILAVRIIQ